MLSMRVAQILLILVGIITLFNGLVKINTDFPLGIAYFSMSLACTSVILGFESIIQGNKSTRIAKEARDIARESRDIANESNTIATESRNRMDTIGDAEIKQCVINMESLRKDYFYGLQEYLHTPIANGTVVNIGHLQQINIFTTWLELENIDKAIIYKEYMDDDQQFKFFRLHRTLIENVLEISQNPIVSNESVSQLLTGIIKLYENLNETRDFHQEYYAVINGFLGMIRPNENFLNYVKRKKQELAQFEEHDLFDFQTLDEIQIS